MRKNNSDTTNLPTFLFIGTGKAGSTSLYYYLKEHPQVFMSPIKETNFFSYEGGRPNFCGPGDSEGIAHQTTITDIKDYQNNFRGRNREKAVGEVSPSYMYIPEAPQRIKRYIPEAKMIAILRHPVDRAYSNFQHRWSLNVEPLTDFSQAIAEEKMRIKNNWAPTWHYLQQGFYYEQLKRYFDLFERRQLKIYLFEDWLSNKLGLIQDIFEFIGVEPAFVPNMDIRYNVSGKPKSLLLNSFLSKQNGVKTLIKKVAPQKILSQVSSKANLANSQRLPKLPFQVRQELNQLYKPDIIKLQDLIERDLSSWL